MQFSDYQDFRLAVQKLIEGEDIDEATFSVNTLDLMIGLGEERVYNGDEEVQGLRASTMVADLSLASPYTLPADLLQLKEIYFSGKPPVDIVPLAEVRRMIATGSGASQPLLCAQDGETLTFWPTTTDAALGSYYAKPEPLETGNWGDQTTIARYPDVYVYAAMTEAMGFLGFDSRVPFWQSKFRTAMQSAMTNERLRVFGGSKLRVRAR